MILPSRRLILLVALGAPPALLVGVVAPGLWLLPLAWIVALLALAAFDISVAPARVGVAIAAPRAVGVGEAFTLALTSAGGAPSGLRAALAADPRLASATAGRAAFDPAGRADIALTAIRRGVARLAAVDLRWRGPLGLAWRQRRQAIDTDLLVTPDVRPVRDQGVAILSREARAGMMAQLETGQGGEFDALAEYRPGMDRRRLDWKSSARHSKLLAKEYRTERDNNIVLAFDCGRTMVEPLAGLARLDRAIAAGLLTAYVSLKMGDRVSLFGFDARPRVAGAALAGVGAFAGLQKLAASLDYSSDETNFTLGLTTLAARLDRRSLVLLFTDFTDTTSAELMLRATGRLLKRHVVICVVLRDDELEGLAAAEPKDADDVSRAVIAAGLLRERRIVLTRLQRMGVEVLEAPWQEMGPQLARRYLDAKRRRL